MEQGSFIRPSRVYTNPSVSTSHMVPHDQPEAALVSLLPALKLH